MKGKEWDINGQNIETPLQTHEGLTPIENEIGKRTKLRNLTKSLVKSMRAELLNSPELKSAIIFNKFTLCLSNQAKV